METICRDRGPSGSPRLGRRFPVLARDRGILGSEFAGPRGDAEENAVRDRQVLRVEPGVQRAGCRRDRGRSSTGSRRSATSRRRPWPGPRLPEDEHRDGRLVRPGPRGAARNPLRGAFRRKARRTRAGSVTSASWAAGKAAERFVSDSRLRKTGSISLISRITGPSALPASAMETHH